MKIVAISALLPVLGLTFAVPLAADPDPFLWPTNLEEAQEASSTTGRPMIVYVMDSV
jgi:hypothetical protein